VSLYNPRIAAMETDPDQSLQPGRRRRLHLLVCLKDYAERGVKNPYFK
jgi:hypothetical protein